MEAVEPFFFQCNLVYCFWADAFGWMHQKTPARLTLLWDSIASILLLKFYIFKG